MLTLESQKKMKDNYDFALEYIRCMEKDQIQQLAEYILFRCQFQIMRTPDKALAFQAFRSQTGKGKNLQPSDIFKAELIAALGDDTVGARQLADLWATMERTLGREPSKKGKLPGLQRFLRTLAEIDPESLLEGRRKPAQDAGADVDFEILDTFVERLKRRGSLDALARDGLRTAYRAYCIAIGLGSLTEEHDLERPSSQCSADVHSALTALRLNVAGDALELASVATLMVLRYGDNCGLLLVLLKRLDSLAAYLTMCLTKGARSARYSKVLSELSKTGDDVDAAGSLQLSKEEKVALHKVVAGQDLYKERSSKACLLALLRLDLPLRENQRCVEFNELTTVSIEHVLPMAPELGSR